MLSELFDAYGERLVYATLGLGLAFLALIIVLWFVRSRGGPAPFLKGGRNRQPRLQVLDATAVDARRRLVLVRRDNVEHLIMIGGPTDIVVESGIGAIPIMTDVTQTEQLAISAQQSPVQQSRMEPVPSLETAAPVTGAKRQETSPAFPGDDSLIDAQEPNAVPKQTLKPAQPVANATPTPTPIQNERASIAKVEAPATVAVNPPPRLQPAATSPTQKATRATEAPKPASSPVTTAAMRPRPSMNASAGASFAGATANSIAQKVEPALSDDAFTKKQVDDLFGETRDRVLPDIALPSIKIDDDVSDKLRDDFESFLNAEIEKNALDAPPVEPVKLTASTPEKTVITGANIDKDAQQQMARIFGEMATKDS